MLIASELSISERKKHNVHPTYCLWFFSSFSFLFNPQLNQFQLIVHILARWFVFFIAFLRSLFVRHIFEDLSTCINELQRIRMKAMRSSGICHCFIKMGNLIYASITSWLVPHSNHYFECKRGYSHKQPYST